MNEYVVEAVLLLHKCIQKYNCCLVLCYQVYHSAEMLSIYFTYISYLVEEKVYE